MEDVSTDYKENSKKLWSFIKSKGQEWTGVAPLKNKMGFLQSDNKSKAEILNEQLQSVFTKENLNNCPNKGKRLTSRYHLARLCKSVRQSVTPTPST